MKRIKKNSILMFHLKELSNICGYPQYQYDLSKFGKKIRVWMWDSSKLVPKRNKSALLVLADKAKDLDLEVYIFNVGRRGTRKEMFREIAPDKLGVEEFNRVVVWCSYSDN